MPRIKIVPSGTLNFASRLDSNLNQLNNIASQISSAASRLNWSVKSKSNIDSSIQNALDRSNSLMSELRSLSSYVKNATGMLIEADNSGARGINKKYGKYNKNIIGINQKLYENRAVGKKPAIRNPGDYYFEDEDGSGISKVYYLMDDEGAGIPNPFGKKSILPQGHAAVVLEKTNGGAIYYSWGSNQDADPAKIILGNDSPGILNRRDMSPEDLMQFKKTGKLPIYQEIETITQGSSYTRFLSVPVSGQQGKDMFKKAQEIFNGEGTYNRDNYNYNLYNNNCNQNAQKIFSAANLDFTLSGAPSKGAGALAGAAQAFDDLLITAPITESLTDKLGVVPKESYNAGVNRWMGISGFVEGKFKGLPGGGGGGGSGW
jgi:hypothetical protein